MATTQNGRKGTGGLLKPLNIAPSVPRQRRTPEQALQAKIDKQHQMAERAQARAKELAEKQKRANERAERARLKADQIKKDEERKRQEAAQRAKDDADLQAHIKADSQIGGDTGPSTVPAVKMTPELDKTIKAIQKDFERFYAHIHETYGVKFVGELPTLVKRGFLSTKARGELAPSMNPVETTSETGVAREAVRFMQHYKLVGLTPAWLNKEVKLKDDPATYTLTGLRGKAHHVVLRKNGTNEAYTMPPDDFKKLLVTT